MVEVLTFEQFALRNGAGRWSFADAGLHTRGHMSDAAHRSAMRRQIEAGHDLGERREALREKFAQLVAAGEVREPTRLERLIETANGHPDNQSTRAARRILTKRGVKW